MKYSISTEFFRSPTDAQVERELKGTHETHEPKAEFVSTSKTTDEDLRRRANKVQLLTRPQQTRLRPPTSRNRIYSDAELAVATDMFQKLKRGEDRVNRRSVAPRVEWSDDIKGPIDPLDRVADVLLDLFEL